ncbi:MAG: ABC transporter ATP-binding protein, partial [Stellaceae bacterium]
MSNLLQVRDLSVRFTTPGGHIDAVKNLSFRIGQGSTVAIVGESGSGKSTVSQAILRILPRNGHIAGGQILFDDPRDAQGPVDLAVLAADGAEMRALRGGSISIVFQEPMSSLSPLHTVGNQVGEALALHRGCTGAELQEMGVDMLRLVGFPDPARAWRSYPFELSGGLRQRAMIAMALVCRPALLILDEPTTALDVTIQAQILKLVVELQHELNMAVLLITHDLGVVANIAEEIVVMYHGEVMEAGSLDDIFRHAEHPYLKALLRAVPRFDMKPGERLVPIREVAAGDAPHLMAERTQWPAGPTAPLLECAGVRKVYAIRNSGWFGGGSGAARVVAVDEVSLKIERGECLGLVGESGCGKTTLSKVLLRAVTPDAGSISFNDRGRLIDVLALD